ncbi:ABC transporter substrate-binding protein, partial [Variovorax sp. RHLX14]
MPRHSSVRLCRCLLRKWAFAVLALYLVTVGHTVQAQDRPLKKVTIAVGSQVLNISYPWLMMPLALGYWKQEGYDVNVIGVSGSAQALQQLASGGIEFAELNATNLIQANTDGNAKVRGVMGNGVIDWGLAVIDGGAITDVKDLKSK